MQTIYQKLKVQSDGCLEVQAQELLEGMEVEVTIQVTESTEIAQSPLTVAERLRAISKKRRRIHDFSPLESQSAAINEHLRNEMTKNAVIDEAQRLLRRFISEDVSLVDELIADRRADSKRE